MGQHLKFLQCFIILILSKKKFFILVMIIKKFACEKEQASSSIWAPYYVHLIIIISLLSWYPLSSYHIILFVGSIGRRQVLLNFVEKVNVLDMFMSGFTCGLGGYLPTSVIVKQFCDLQFWESLNQSALRKFDFSWGKFVKLAQKTLGEIGSIAMPQLWEFLQSYLYCHCVSYRCHDHHWETRLDQSCD